MTQTILKLISENQVIMLDTSVAMDGQFEKLVDTMEMPLMERKKKIIVKNAVWAELLRHLGSRDTYKQRMATRAVEIISMHQNIFRIDDDGVDSEKILRAFADAEFLADLMIHKNRYTQALLTNDKKLSRDAFRLNAQESCMGKQISVYNLDSTGDIIYCELELEDGNTEEIANEDKNAQNEIEAKKEDSIVAPIIGTAVTSISIGFLIGKYGKQIVNAIRAIA